VGDAVAGVVNTIKKRMKESTSEVTRQWYGKYFASRLPGLRWGPLAAGVARCPPGGQSLVAITSMTVAAADAHFQTLGLTGARAQIADEILKEVNARLGFLLDVGLEY